MAICSFARWRPLPENATEPFIDVTQFIFHTQVGYFDGLYSWFARDSVNVESHFGLSMSGLLDQYIDTARQADANRKANWTAISLECEDKGDPNNPYTDAQIEGMIRLARWSMEHHPIPPRVCANPYDPGFGWHAMWGSPSAWTPVRGKTCPGTVRIQQLESIILPEIFGGTPMTTYPVAVVVREEDGVDAGAGYVYRSRLSTLLGMDVPVLPYSKAKGNVGHAVIIGDTRGMDFREFPSFTIFKGDHREATGQVLDALLGGTRDEA